MTMTELLTQAKRVLEIAKTGLLVTVDSDGYPHTRWMTPVFLGTEDKTLYCVTSPDFEKIKELRSNPKVQWSIQDPPLQSIVTLKGRINIIENPSLEKEVMELINPYLHVFWREAGQNTEFIVLETICEGGTYFAPMRGIKEEI